jgi:glutamate racemase
MDKRPIGIFDSGLGGLTVVKKLAQLLPEEDFIYLGDTGRVPYGSRSYELITKYAFQNAAFLMEYDIKAMVIACNTVCSVAFRALKELNEMYDIPIYEVVSAPAKAAAANTRNGKIGVIGTSATIKSGAYETALKKYDPNIKIYSVKCPLFVPLVEEGWFHAVDEVALVVAERYLDGLCESEIDTLILGCTHYPLLRDVISKIMGPDVALIDSGAETAKYVADDLDKRDMLTTGEVNGSIKYFVTDSVEGFNAPASNFLESDVQGKVKQVIIE